MSSTAETPLPSALSTLYSHVVRYLFLPFIDRFLNVIVGNSCELLRLSVPSIGWRKEYGGKKMDNNNEPPLPISLTISNPIHFSWSMLLDQKLGLGESYMAGDWTAQPNCRDFLKMMIRAKKETNSKRPKRSKTLLKRALSFLTLSALSALRTVTWLINYVGHIIKENTVQQSANNIRDHYDLGNDMFELFLDKTMTYSCAEFKNPGVDVPEYNNDVLEEAQLRKIDSLVERLQLTEDDHVLEIGCGWGACAVRAVERYGCKWTGLTLSHEQLEWAQQKVAEANLDHLINLKYLDYRLETGVYSKIISIEMIEAVGEKYLPEYFSKINERLQPGGVAVLQGITCPDAYYERYCRSSDFIKKHIFPGGHLPSIGHILRCLPHGLQMGENTSKIGRHYATTLDYWLCAWLQRESEVLSLGYSPVFHRKWDFYFSLCSALFAYDHIDTVQFTLTKAVY